MLYNYLFFLKDNLNGKGANSNNAAENGGGGGGSGGGQLVGFLRIGRSVDNQVKDMIRLGKREVDVKELLEAEEEAQNGIEGARQAR